MKQLMTDQDWQSVRTMLLGLGREKQQKVRRMPFQYEVLRTSGEVFHWKVRQYD